ncbi:MAG: hypothetical protein IJP80_08150 [Bacteroidales bacterium]|nr:hypothetical protein [Bacteroidales bacterium]
MAIIRQRASSRIKRFYSNAMRSHITLSREAVLAIMQKMRAEMLALDDGIPGGCHIVNPSYLSFWNDNGWTDVSSTNTRWHYAFTHTRVQAVIHDAEHSQNMADAAERPV